MSNPWERATITFEVVIPGQLPKRKSLQLDADTFEAALAPRPRDRELWFCIDSHTRDLEQMRARQQLADRLGRMFAAELLGMLGAQDTVNGYAPETQHGT